MPPQTATINVKMPPLVGIKLKGSAFTNCLLCLRKGGTLEECRQQTGLDLNTVRFCSLSQFVATPAKIIINFDPEPEGFLEPVIIQQEPAAGTLLSPLPTAVVLKLGVAP
jgi:hypothetical protein